MSSASYHWTQSSEDTLFFLIRTIYIQPKLDVSHPLNHAYTRTTATPRLPSQSQSHLPLTSLSPNPFTPIDSSSPGTTSTQLSSHAPSSPASNTNPFTGALVVTTTLFSLFFTVTVTPGSPLNRTNFSGSGQETKRAKSFSPFWS